jgi:hypothetical protein
MQILLLLASLGVAQGAGLDDPQVHAFLARHCTECHGATKPKGDFRLEQLAAGDRWTSVAEQLQSGAMPPKAKPRPDAAELKTVIERIRAGLEAADSRRRAEHGRVVLRRLNRVEYSNTVGDLLGVETDFKGLLALDGTSDGFDNVGAALHLSSFALERYLEAAGTALDVAIVNRTAPAKVQKHTTLKNSHYVRTYKENFYRVLDDETVVCFMSTHDTRVYVDGFWPQDRGYYRFRICASGYQSSGKPVTFDVTSLTTGLIGYFDAPPDKPTVFEFVARFEPQSALSILPYGLPNTVWKTPGKATIYTGPGLAVHWIDFEGPLYESWPPPSHRRLFGDRIQASISGDRSRLEVVSSAPLADAEELLRGVVRRAFRRDVTDADVRPFVDIVKTRLEEKDSFEQAMRAAYSAVMTSPRFLFLDEKPGKLDDFALASRLSYFFWSTMPDDELLDLAAKGRLGQPALLRAQVERMLKSPKAEAFTRNFCGQWLGLRDIDFTEPSGAYPEFDQMLKASMAREPELFFAEILKEDLSLANFVSSDFSFLNGRLSKHYGIAGIDGWEFRKAALPPESHRGGVMTMAGVLKVTANGTTTSPITRGVWVLERILGTPPPKPPANVAALEPDIRGAKTLREQLAKHRNDPSCASCHSRIDPPGFVLENFDVIGGWRDFYRVTNWGPGVKEVKGQRYLRAQDVDPTAELADGQKIRNIDEFKQTLLRDKDQLARSLARRLVTYATGGAPESSDQREIEAIVAKVRAKNYGFRTLIHEIVQSRLFREK